MTPEKVCHEPEYLTVEETADLLRVSPRTVRNWIRDGKLARLKIAGTVRIARRDIDRARNTATQQPASHPSDSPETGTQPETEE